MSTTEILLFAGLAIFIIATQLGRRPVGLSRFLTPLVAVVAVAFTYLHGIPTVGGDLSFDAACTLAGLALGLLAAACVRVERDARTGRLMLRAGLAYAAVWVLAFGGRLAFGWAAQGVWRDAVVQFSIAHQITGAAAWTAAFVLMAIAMVATRTAVLLLRVLLAGRSVPAAQALAA
jgi:hypothetical protein